MQDDHQCLSILIVDDETQMRKTVRLLLESNLKPLRFIFGEAADGREAVQAVRDRAWDLVIMDVRMPHLDGLRALQYIKEIDPSIVVILMTAHSHLDDAIFAIKHGALDYVVKPVEPDRLKKLVESAIHAREMVSGLAVSRPMSNDDVDSKFVGSSQKMKEIFALIHKLSFVDTTVFIRGENGTGKELVARAIHQNSPRKKGPYVGINCGAIPENLVESELFGHEKGAFTGATQRKIGKFQLANNGTLFLDEIGELKADIQVKLLRVLQERKFMPIGSNREVTTNARIIAATNRNIEKMIADGSFREDLFYRLNVMPIFLPPLRERFADLEQLCYFFITKFRRIHKSDIRGITPETLALLKQHRWPGNIRELENVIEHAFIIESSASITPSSLPDAIRYPEFSKPARSVGTTYFGPLNFDRFKKQVEKDFIINALKANRGRINQTVAQAGIPKNTLLRKIKKYQIDAKNYL